jgi:hypothetical protein
MKDVLERLLDPNFSNRINVHNLEGAELIEALAIARQIVPRVTIFNGTEQSDVWLQPSGVKAYFDRHLEPKLRLILNRSARAPEEHEIALQLSRGCFAALVSILQEEVMWQEKAAPTPAPDEKTANKLFGEIVKVIDETIIPRLKAELAKGEVTAGDLSMSRRAHSQNAVDGLRNIRNWVRHFEKNDWRTENGQTHWELDDVTLHVATMAHDVFFSAFQAGQDAQLAIGKDTEKRAVLLVANRKKGSEQGNAVKKDKAAEWRNVVAEKHKEPQQKFRADGTPLNRQRQLEEYQALVKEVTGQEISEGTINNFLSELKRITSPKGS